MASFMPALMMIRAWARHGERFCSAITKRPLRISSGSSERSNCTETMSTGALLTKLESERSPESDIELGGVNVAEEPGTVFLTIFAAME